MSAHERRPGESWDAYVARRNPPKESSLCPLCWPEQRRRSLCPPYGACDVCVAGEQSAAAALAAGPGGGVL